MIREFAAKDPVAVAVRYDADDADQHAGVGQVHFGGQFELQERTFGELAAQQQSDAAGGYVQDAARAALARRVSDV